MGINKDTVIAHINGFNACRYSVVSAIKEIIENLVLNKDKHPEIMIFASAEALQCLAEMIAKMDIPDIEKVDDFFVESIRSMCNE